MATAARDRFGAIVSLAAAATIITGAIGGPGCGGGTESQNDAGALDAGSSGSGSGGMTGTGVVL